MKKLFCLITLFFLLTGFSGCAYVNIKTPYDTDLERTALGSKIGKSEYYSLLWLVAWGDAGTEAAAKNGGISVINHMDRELLAVFFGLYVKSTTVLYGD